MAYTRTKAWQEARAKVDTHIGHVVDEFVQGHHNAVAGMCDMHLKSLLTSEARNTFLVRARPLSACPRCLSNPFCCTRTL